MKQIKLTQGKVALVDDSDFEFLNSFKWHIQKNYNTFYAIRNKKKKNKKQTTVRMHRELLNPSSKMQIDHIDGNGLNNQRLNLRVVTNQENQFNQRLRKNTSSQYKGVTFNKRVGLWVAQIVYNKNHIDLGYFDDEIECAIAYNQNATKLFGHYAWLNPIPDEYKNRISVKRKQVKAEIQSSFVGVNWDKRRQKWRTQFQKNKKRYHLGFFDDENEAHQVYLKAKNGK